jgi:hypothetical protein
MWEYGGGVLEDMYAWLRADAAAVDRAATPWVVAAGHKTRFMGGTDFSVLDGLFKDAGVDLYVAGHAHNYQRIAPNDNGVREACGDAAGDAYTDCANYVAVVSGSPGNREIADHPDAAKAPADVLDAFNQNYGFSRLTAVNASVLLFSFEEVKVRDARGALVARDGAFTDSFAIVRSPRGRAARTRVAFDERVALVGDVEL